MFSKVIMYDMNHYCTLFYTMIIQYSVDGTYIIIRHSQKVLIKTICFLKTLNKKNQDCLILHLVKWASDYDAKCSSN